MNFSMLQSNIQQRGVLSFYCERLSTNAYARQVEKRKKVPA